MIVMIIVYLEVYNSLILILISSLCSRKQ